MLTHMLKQSIRLIAALVVTAVYATLNYGFGLSVPANILTIIFAAAISITIIIDIIKTFKSGRYGVDILALTAIVTTLIVGEYLASLIIIIMLTGGEFLEYYANNRAKRELTKLVERAPTIAHLQENGQIIDIRVGQVKIGDTILVKTGEMLPLDGILESANTNLDTSSLTGEALPRAYKKGDRVLSGSINQEKPLTMKVSAIYRDSQYSQIIQMVKELESKPSDFVRLADRYAIPFTIVAYIIAGFAWYVSGDFTRFVEVMVVASPCPLILAAPIAFISGMSRASREGVIIKSGNYLEEMADAVAIAFDKTGTLTKGNLVIDEVTSFDTRYPKEKILSIIAGAEQMSSHVIARSITDYAKHHSVKPAKINKIKEHVGLGLDFRENGQNFYVGNINHMAMHHIHVERTISRAKASILLAVNSEIVGQITFTDELRKDAKSVIRKVKKLGLDDVAMVTGDGLENAEPVSEATGINHYYAECLPADKVKVMQERLKRPNIFVGDGLNDAPVMAAADVGIALAGYGSTAASDAADVVVMSNNLSKVPVVIGISKRTMSVARQSVIGGIAICTILMLCASFGFIPIILGAILQEAMDVVAILNALRANK